MLNVETRSESLYYSSCGYMDMLCLGSIMMYLGRPPVFAAEAEGRFLI